MSIFTHCSLACSVSVWIFSNETSSGIVVGEEIEAVDNYHPWKWGRYSIDTVADGHSLHNYPRAASGTTVPQWPRYLSLPKSVAF